MFAFVEARIDNSLKQQFIAGYREDTKYSAIVKDLISATDLAAKDSGPFSRAGLPFVMVDSLLYNVRPNGVHSLYIPHNLVKQILSFVHNAKHHFGEDRILYDLRGVSMANKTRKVKKYVKHYP
jgi:hypothetical protein